MCPHYLFVAVCTLCIIGGKRCMCNVTPVMGTAPPVHPVRECVYNEAPVMDTAPPGPPAEVRAPTTDVSDRSEPVWLWGISLLRVGHIIGRA